MTPLEAPSPCTGPGADLRAQRYADIEPTLRKAYTAPIMRRARARRRASRRATTPMAARDAQRADARDDGVGRSARKLLLLQPTRMRMSALLP